MNILSFDQSIAKTGYNVMSNDYTLVEYGLIKTNTKNENPKRLMEIYSSVNDIILKHKPDVIVVEDSFMQKNVQTLKILNQVRGAIMVCAAFHEKPVKVYTPTEAKHAVTGKGNASKEEVRQAVLLKYPFKDINEDIADSIALSITYLNEVDNK